MLRGRYKNTLVYRISFTKVSSIPTPLLVIPALRLNNSSRYCSDNCNCTLLVGLYFRFAFVFMLFRIHFYTLVGSHYQIMVPSEVCPRKFFCYQFVYSTTIVSPSCSFSLYFQFILFFRNCFIRLFFSRKCGGKIARY